jgi:prepilin-type N-terminal cleavage/methylation domain-containing protein
MTGGFTLIELLVSISIMLVITAVVLLNQGTYSSNISLTNLANDISLTIRQAQIYGVSVRELQTGSGDFSSAYGVDFNILGTNVGGDSAYIFFADRGVTKNGIYDDLWSCPLGGSSECLQKIPTSTGNSIKKLCILYTNGTSDCTIKRADITFRRPSTSANLVFFNSGGGLMSPVGVLGAEVDVNSSTGARSVIVYITGQISVK